MTAGLQCPAEFIPAPGTLMCPADDSQFPWMSVAMGELGVREVVGSRRSDKRRNLCGGGRALVG